MKRLILCVLLAFPVAAQTVPDPFDVVDQLTPFIAADDMEGIYATLSRAVLAARETDSLSADWSFVFSLFSDHVRVYKNDPAYALRIAEEGMDLLGQGAAPDPQMVALLNWSRAYALADLGRLAEAAEIARLTVPQLRQAFDDKTADDFLATANTWARGELTTFNASAEVTAQTVAEQAYEAANASDYGRALTLAAQATLPDGSGLPPDAVLRVNTTAAVVRGRALYQLGRVADAQAALLAAAEALLQPGWRAQGATPLWRLDPAQTDGRGWEVLFWLARCALDTQDYPLAERALEIAAPLSPTREQEQSTVFLRNALANAQGRFAQADAMLLELAAKSRSAGDAHGAATAEFYVARNRAGRTETWAEVNTAEMIRATDAAVSARQQDEALNADFFQVEAASYLVNTDAVAQGLAYARAGLAGWKARTGNGTATEIETAGDQLHTRVIVDILLYGANRLAERDPRAICPGATGTGCVIIVDFP